MWEHVFKPDSISRALEYLDIYHPHARVIAGGTDLVLQLQSGEKSSRYLVDISMIKGLNSITEDSNSLTVGACATHAEIASSMLIHKYARVLALAAEEVGSPQIRSLGTLGGNVVNAQPAADPALAITALRAEAKIRTLERDRWVPVIELYQNPGISKLDSSKEIIEAFCFKKITQRTGSSYRRLGKCKSIALPVLCAAAVVQLADIEDHIVDCSLVIGPVAPTPCTANEVTDWIRGKPAVDEVLAEAARIARLCSHPRSSLLRCSADYREEMVEVVVRSVLAEAVHEAKMRRCVEKTS